MQMSDKLNWRDEFSKEVINQSRDYMDSIVDIFISNGFINANIKKSVYFHVNIHVKDNKLEEMSCTCRKNDHCKHQAAVLRYVEENNIFEKEKDFLNLTETVDVYLLKEYLIEILNED